MAIQVTQPQLFFLVLLLVNLLNHIGGVTAHFSRSSFPAGFIFGTASAAYQYEGAAKENGRGPSVWDTFCHEHPEKIKDHSSGDVAIDSYHRYKEDVSVMKEMGMDAYRFSISWSRLLPNGKLSGGVNKEGVQYYNNLINELLANNIQPFVTLFHWDTPQALADKYGGFLSADIVDDFQDFAELCYREYGDRVKNWITLNEPLSVASLGYNVGSYAPGRCSKWVGNCSAGNSQTEPYLVGHYLLLSHAAAVKIYRDKYQASQKGKIGMTINTNWFIPNTEHHSDVAAAKRALDFNFGWFLSPIIYGKYPKSMRSIVKHRLPKFSTEQAKMLTGSYDFVGVNYYTTSYAANDDGCKEANSTYSTDSCVKGSQERNGIPIGPATASDWLFVYPQGLQELLQYTKKEYNNPVIYITENGVSEIGNITKLKDAVADKQRIDYYDQHLRSVHRAIKKGVDVKGYFAWSLFDNFEWTVGYTVRFGINYVDYKDGLKRYPKHSALWFKKFLQTPNKEKSKEKSIDL